MLGNRYLAPSSFGDGNAGVNKVNNSLWLWPFVPFDCHHEGNNGDCGGERPCWQREAGLGKAKWCGVSQQSSNDSAE